LHRYAMLLSVYKVLIETFVHGAGSS